jgi:hypothetical protein
VSTSTFTRRLAHFMGVSEAKAKDAQKAFDAALKEEVEARFPAKKVGEASVISLDGAPLVIAGLGSFKMRMRPEMKFDAFRYAQNKSLFGNDGPRETVTKPPSRRLIFTAKWEPIKP